MSRVGFLQFLCNRYGDFKAAAAFVNRDGDIIWSRHRSVLECWSSDEGLEFLAKVNNRTILVPEIILDMDKNPTEDRMNKICDWLETNGMTFRAYFSGSRGYHIHIIIPELALHPEPYRRKIRQFLINKFDCDGLKSSEKSMIALENCPHWRTGKMKKMLRCSKWLMV